MSTDHINIDDDQIDTSFRFEDDEGTDRVARSADPGNRELQFEPLKFNRNREDSAESAGSNKQGFRGTSGRRKTSKKQKNQQQMFQNQNTQTQNNASPKLDANGEVKKETRKSIYFYIKRTLIY